MTMIFDKCSPRLPAAPRGRARGGAPLSFGLGLVAVAGLATGCSWEEFHKKVSMDFEEHTETIEWKKSEKAKLETYDVVDEGNGVYQVPVRVAMEMLVDDPALLAPVIEIEEDLSGMSLVQQGEQHFKITYACAGCHSLEGNRLVGPPLNNRWGGEAPLESGEVVAFDDAYFRESVWYSREKIARGYPPAMPVFAETMTEEHYEAIVAYVKQFQ